MWIIGDKFINRNYHALQKLKTEAIMTKKPLPYVYDYYNLSCFTPNPKSLLENTLARIINALIKALNDATKMPRIILIIPEGDILDFIGHSEKGMREAIFKCLEWLVKHIDRSLEAKNRRFAKAKAWCSSYI